MKKRRRIVGMKPLWMAGLLVVMFSTIFAMAGCSKDTSKDTTNPNTEAFEPKGTIQGIVRDSVTLQPIAGAKVSVGLKEATSDNVGQFVIKDVPATTDALDGTVIGTYQLTVDLKNATSPVKMTDVAATPRYPDVSYRTVTVNYTSLNDAKQDCPAQMDQPDIDGADDPTDNDSIDSTSTSSSASCGTSATNHDTPVEGLVGSIVIGIGKNDANITGVVAGCRVGQGDFFTPVGAGYTVQLFTRASAGDTGSGAAGHLLQTATTDADGEFSFTKVEANLPITITATSPDGTRTDTIINASPADGLTLDLTSIQASNALHACSTDIHGPEIVGVNPLPGTDMNKGTNTVDFTFSEAVKQTPFTSIEPSGQDNLYDYIDVFFAGTKAGNVKYTLAWDTTTYKKLTVSIPDTGISSLYYVRIKDVNTILADAEGNAVGMGLCPDDSDAPAAYGIVANPASNDCTAWFSTTGATDPAAPEVSLVNAAAIDEATTTGHNAVFDWTLTPNAKTYNVYCRKVQIWEGGIVNEHTYSSGAGITVTGSSATVDFDTFTDGVAGGAAFVENSEIKLGYDCQVAGVSADGVEGERGDAPRVVDTVGPLLAENAPTGGGALVCGTGDIVGGLPTGIGAVCDDAANPDNITKIILGYNEEIDETSAETVANYAFSGLASGTAAISSTTAPIYNPTTDMVLLTLSDTITPAEIAPTVVKTGGNGILNTTVPGADTAYVAACAGIKTDLAGTDATMPNTTGLCVDEGPDGTIDTAVAAGVDDIAATTGGITRIYAGPNGICDTTANNSPAGVTADDIQVVAVGARSGVCGTEIAGGAGSDVVEAGDDEDTTAGVGGGFITTGNNGICETAGAAYTAGGGTLLIAVDSSTPNSVGIYTGGDGDLDVVTLNNAVGCPSGSTLDDSITGTMITVSGTVSGVTDVAGNAIRPAGDVFRSDGNTE